MKEEVFPQVNKQQTPKTYENESDITVTLGKDVKQEVTEVKKQQKPTPENQ